MQPIPKPEILDPDRLLANNRGDFTSDHKARAELLDDALHETCEYAQQLWTTLNGARGYLVDSLPPDPRSPEAASRPWTAPTGPDDDLGWQQWIEEFSAVTSVLCGPNGDSGYGLREARHAAEIRRSAPTLKMHARRPQLDTGSPHPNPAPAGSPAVSKLQGAGWVAATAALVVLAARGLRPRRG